MITRALALCLLLSGLTRPTTEESLTRPVRPVLDFPDPSLDDTASYQGYQTRFYRDSKQNTVQIYLQPHSGRVVTLWADAANESLGFTVRDAQGRGVRPGWDNEVAEVGDSGATRALEFRLTVETPTLELGGFLLGSMRVERDIQYGRRHLEPFSGAPFRVAEESLLVADIARLPPGEQKQHLMILHAADVGQLRSRLQPAIAVTRSSAGTEWIARVDRPSLDGRNHLALEFRVKTREADLSTARQTVVMRSRSGPSLRFAVRVLTDASPLTPLSRGEIFNRDFLSFLDRARGASDSAGSARYRRMERQVRGVELLSSHEKLMAGLPNFATYFGRDMMMTALMMRPIWSPAMSEHVIASVLRKLGPTGDVSHEEALGGQAIRENAVVYDSLVTSYLRHARAAPRRADSLMVAARAVLSELQTTRENYHMIDDEFQLPVLASRYLADSTVSPQQKRAFLFDRTDGGRSRLVLLLQEMALVSSWTRPYVEDPRAINLVSFPRRDATHWRSASWRDSDAGYAGGRFAMDVNAIWVPEALQSIGIILGVLPTLGVSKDVLDSIAPAIGGTSLAGYLADPASLGRAVETWRGARRHFEVVLGPTEVRRRVRAKLASLPSAERRYWQQRVARSGSTGDSLSFLALSLDTAGKPIPVVNTDPATGLFLGSVTDPALVLGDVAPFALPYPVGLLIDSVGPVVANDAYASRAIWERFGADAYHSPRVVWGREVNLLFLGLANRILAAGDDAQAQPGYLGTLQNVLNETSAAVEASGLDHNELWSYRIQGGRLRPVRYGTSSDVQLWNTTDLAVEFVLSRLAR